MHRSVRRRPRVRVLALTVIALSAMSALVGVGTPAVATPTARAAEQTITVIGTRAVFSLPGSPSVGTSFIGGGELTDSTDARMSPCRKVR